VSVLRWLRGGDEPVPGSTLGVGGLGGLDAVLSPGKDRQLENLQTLDALRDEAGDGDAGRDRAGPIDLDSGVAVVRVRRDPTDG